MTAAIGGSMPAALELGRRWGISDSDAQILYFVGSLVVAVGLSIITGYYAWQNKRMADQNTRMVEELQRQREAMARQLREMRIQTRLGLYRPRLAVMRGVRKALSLALRDGQVSGDTIAQLGAAIGEKEFLFGPALCELLDEIYQRCVKAYALRNMQGPLMSDERRKEVVASELDEILWLSNQLAALRATFGPYLQVEPLEDDRMTRHGDAP